MDPITFEVLRNAFVAICNESGAMLYRVAYDPVIRDGHDLSVSLLTADGRLVAHGLQDQAAHIGTFESTAQTVLREAESINPGDVFIFNDPYSGGTHTLDVRLVRPIFVDGELFAITTQLCHWPDCGGPIPGTFNPTATECYAEGLRIPPMKLYDRGQPVKATFELIRMNVRLATLRRGDIHAQYEAGRLVERRLIEYCRKFGKETVRAAMEEFMNYSERLFRAGVAQLPDGDYEFEDYGDVDVMHPELPRIRVHARLSIRGDRVTIDLRESDPAPRGAWGFARPALLSAVYDGTMHCFPHLAPLNHGIIRSLEILSRPGTCVDVQEPTPVTGFAAGAYDKVDHVVMGCWNQALAQVDPKRVHAGSLNLENLTFGGIHPRTGQPYVGYLWMEGGNGARTYKDGSSFYMFLYSGGATNQPIEINERWYPITYRKFEAVQDSCGDGQFRGGFAVARDFEFYGESVLTLLGDRAEVTPFGIAGGTNGGPSILSLNEGRPDYRYLGIRCVGERIKPGDVVHFTSNGGGGAGDPLDRDPQLVLEDVLDEFISLEKAREVYGVVIRVGDWEALEAWVDEEATRKLRADLRSRERPRGLGPWQVHPLGERIRPTLGKG